MRRLALLLAGLLVLVVVLISTAGNKPLSPDEVKRIVDAPRLNSYSGYGQTTCRYEGKTLTMRIKVFHNQPDKHRIEYLTSPLRGVTVIENGKQSWRCDPQFHSAASMSSGESDGSRLGLFLQNHRIERVGSDRIAGRSASVLLVKSKSGQAKKRLWVDAKTYIILRSEDYDARGSVQSATRLDSISYAPVSDSLFARPSNAGPCLEGPGKPMSREELTKAVGFQVKPPGYVPKGYRLEGYRLYECPCGCGHKSAYIRYTNGLESISVFETRADAHCLKEGKCDAHKGKCLVRDQLALTTKDGVSFVVLGNLKAQDLRRLTDSIR